MDGILGRIDVVINGPTPDLSSHLINYDGRSLSAGLAVGRERETDVWPLALLISRHSLERGVERISCTASIVFASENLYSIPNCKDQRDDT